MPGYTLTDSFDRPGNWGGYLPKGDGPMNSKNSSRFSPEAREHRSGCPRLRARIVRK